MRKKKRRSETIGVPGTSGDYTEPKRHVYELAVLLFAFQDVCFVSPSVRSS